MQLRKYEVATWAVRRREKNPLLVYQHTSRNLDSENALLHRGTSLAVEVIEVIGALSGRARVGHQTASGPSGAPGPGTKSDLPEMQL